MEIQVLEFLGVRNLPRSLSLCVALRGDFTAGGRSSPALFGRKRKVDLGEVVSSTPALSFKA